MALSGAAAGHFDQRRNDASLLKRNGQKRVAATFNPTIVGVDDGAFKRGHRYDTLLVELVQRRPLDLLPNRDATLVANWLTRNRAIHIVSRDRAGVGYLVALFRALSLANTADDYEALMPWRLATSTN
ncbi:hypothetical protein IHE33_05610 [Mycetohabitans endofungorum]|uniref:hypothetical protein n=1 Tax=Mycetohabitans endofungorum TaxID=417203 RepID=UPI0030D3E82F